MDELTRRATTAYFRSTTHPEIADQPANYSGPVDWKGKTYVVLRSVRGVIAVYRVRNSGALTRVDDWPTALEQY